MVIMEWNGSFPITQLILGAISDKAVAAPLNRQWPLVVCVIMPILQLRK